MRNFLRLALTPLRVWRERQHAESEEEAVGNLPPLFVSFGVTVTLFALMPTHTACPLPWPPRPKTVRPRPRQAGPT